jgi:hypothetical protein
MTNEARVKIYEVIENWYREPQFTEEERAFCDLYMGRGKFDRPVMAAFYVGFLLASEDKPKGEDIEKLPNYEKVSDVSDYM